MVVKECRHFSGYKPCGLSLNCNRACPHLDIPTHRILIVHLEALGAVLRATVVLPAIKRRFPQSHITWVTQKPAQDLLAHNPLIDRLLTSSSDDLLALSALEFDLAFCIDKSLKAAGVLRQSRFKRLFGFAVDSHSGAILPANIEAEELWELGLSNHKKFHVNQKPETQLITEALALAPFARDHYVVSLTPLEQEIAEVRRRTWAAGHKMVVGINTGCSGVIPYKKLSVPYHRELVKELQKRPDVRVVLLGGPEDTLRNQQIASSANVISSPTERGLRDGLCSVAACDVVVTGDSLGMHMAIALGKWVVAWFGPTCAQEIDLFDRGVKVLSQASCSPCWKRYCDKSPMCYDLVAMADLLSGVEKGIAWKMSSSKPHFLETSFSASL